MILKRRKARSPSRISIDLGGFHTRFFSEADGLILDEPSIGLLDMDHQHTGSRAVNNYGLVAAELFEANPAGKRLISPLQSDCTNNVGHSPKMLRYFLQRSIHEGLIGKSPVALLALPGDFTELQSEQLRKACFTAGTSRVHVVDTGIATALGANVPIDESSPPLLIDLGARGARLYAFANNEIVASYSIPCGGDFLTEKLAEGVREHFGVHISDRAAQDTKHRIGCATPPNHQDLLRNSCQVKGLAINEHFETQFSLSADDAFEFLQPAMSRASDSIRAAIQSLPVTFRNNLKETGIILTGGGAQLARVDQMVSEATDTPVTVANRPLSTAARGGGTMLTRIHGSLPQVEPA